MRETTNKTKNQKQQIKKMQGKQQRKRKKLQIKNKKTG